MPEQAPTQQYEIAFRDGGHWVKVILADDELIYLMNARELGGVKVVAIKLRDGLIYDFATNSWRARSCRDENLLWPKFD